MIGQGRLAIHGTLNCDTHVEIITIPTAAMMKKPGAIPDQLPPPSKPSSMLHESGFPKTHGSLAQTTPGPPHSLLKRF